MHSLLLLITDAGDLMVTAPLALGLMLLLWRAGAPRTALAMAAGLGVCFALLAVSKLVFVACGNYWMAGIRSPSGHTGMSTYVYGSYALVLATLLGPRRVPAIAVAAGLLVAAIGASRLFLHCHTPSEVLVGLLFGANALLVFAWFYRAPPRPEQLRPTWLLGLLALVMLMLHGQHAGAEGVLYRVALALRDHYGVCLGPPHPVAWF